MQSTWKGWDLWWSEEEGGLGGAFILPLGAAE